MPDKLKQSKIIPIHKKGEISVPNNYRPISLLSNFDKLHVLEKIMFKRHYNTLYEYQVGFRTPQQS